MPAYPSGAAARKKWGSEPHAGRAVGYGGKGKDCKASYAGGGAEGVAHQEAKQPCKPSQELSQKRP